MESGYLEIPNYVIYEGPLSSLTEDDKMIVGVVLAARCGSGVEGVWVIC